MYLRYRAKYYNEKSKRIEFGFFWAADYLSKNFDLNKHDRIKLEDLIKWFDNNLPIPDYYEKRKNRQEAKSATSWFKDTSEKFIKPMNELADILERNNVEVERISSKRVPGRKIYEDDFQITVIPHRELKEKTK